MALRGKQPDEVKKRLKMLLFGSAGSGKSTAALGFPNPYVIDTEKGIEHSQYVKLLKQNGGALFQTTSFDEVLAEVKALLTEKHSYKTLVIDPLTNIYNDLVETASNNTAEKDPTAFGRHYQIANKQIKRLLSLLVRLDMNIIITSHAKNEYGANMVVLGSTFDCYKKLDYLFDLVLEIQKIGKKRLGVVRKTRIATFNEFEEFEFSYQNIADKYNRDILEKDSEAETLATPEQVSEVKHLIEVLKVEPDVTEKWFTKAGCDSFEDMNEGHIEKCIKSLRDKIPQLKKKELAN